LRKIRDFIKDKYKNKKKENNTQNYQNIFLFEGHLIH
jgi:hypothetical protein